MQAQARNLWGGDGTFEWKQNLPLAEWLTGSAEDLERLISNLSKLGPSTSGAIGACITDPVEDPRVFLMESNSRFIN